MEILRLASAAYIFDSSLIHDSTAGTELQPCSDTSTRGESLKCPLIGASRAPLSSGSTVTFLQTHALPCSRGIMVPHLHLASVQIFVMFKDEPVC